jgi:hypothetical protein
MKSPVQARPTTRGSLLKGANEVSQSCNWLKCGASVAACAAVCIGSFGSAACIACLGPAYDSCKDCF